MSVAGIRNGRTDNAKSTLSNDRFNHASGLFGSAFGQYLRSSEVCLGALAEGQGAKGDLNVSIWHSKRSGSIPTLERRIDGLRRTKLYCNENLLWIGERVGAKLNALVQGEMFSDRECK
jgi:hypothetical protein